MAVRGWQTASKLLEGASGSSAHWRIRCHEQRPEEARLQFRGINDLLCVHAGCGDGGRSCCAMLPAEKVINTAVTQQPKVAPFTKENNFIFVTKPVPLSRPCVMDAARLGLLYRGSRARTQDVYKFQIYAPERFLGFFFS
jgi:hypothetical protein